MNCLSFLSLTTNLFTSNGTKPYATFDYIQDPTITSVMIALFFVKRNERCPVSFSSIFETRQQKTIYLMSREIIIICFKQSKSGLRNLLIWEAPWFVYEKRGFNSQFNLNVLQFLDLEEIKTKKPISFIKSFMIWVLDVDA